MPLVMQMSANSSKDFVKVYDHGDLSECVCEVKLITTNLRRRRLILMGSAEVSRSFDGDYLVSIGEREILRVTILSKRSTGYSLGYSGTATVFRRGARDVEGDS